MNTVSTMALETWRLRGAYHSHNFVERSLADEKLLDSVAETVERGTDEHEDVS